MPKNKSKLTSNKKNEVDKITTDKIDTQWFDNFINWFKIVSSVFICILIFSYVFKNTYDLVFNAENKLFYATILKRTFLLLICICLLIVSYYYLFKSSISSKKKNISLLAYSTVIFFLVFEIIFMHLPISQGSGEAYCMRLWFKKYWHKNEMGFRDVPYNLKSDSSKNKIVVVGDSYVAGHGIKDVNDRITNVLEKKLGKEYRVFNLGKNGANTKEEFNMLRPFPYKYDKLILVHVPNDLEYIVNKDDNVNMEYLEQKSGFLKRESFFVNFLSYTFIGQAFNGIAAVFSLKNIEKEKTNYAFSNPANLKLHVQNLHYMDSAIQKNNIKFLLVSFPFPGDEDPIGRKYYNLFIEQLKQNNINYLDAAPICDLLSTRQQIVSKLDMHPSKALQKIVADSIYQKLKKEKWID